MGALLDGLASKGYQNEPPCRAQDRQICPPLHRDRTGRDQAAPETHHIHHAPDPADAREPEPAPLARADTSGQIARHFVPRPLPTQGPERHPRLHGLRGPGREPARAHQAAPEQGRAHAPRQADREADPPRPRLHAPLLRRHPHRSQARERAHLHRQRGGDHRVRARRAVRVRHRAADPPRRRPAEQGPRGEPDAALRVRLHHGLAAAAVPELVLRLVLAPRPLGLRHEQDRRREQARLRRQRLRGQEEGQHQRRRRRPALGLHGAGRGAHIERQARGLALRREAGPRPRQALGPLAPLAAGARRRGARAAARACEPAAVHRGRARRRRRRGRACRAGVLERDERRPAAAAPGRDREDHGQDRGPGERDVGRAPLHGRHPDAAVPLSRGHPRRAVGDKCGHLERGVHNIRAPDGRRLPLRPRVGVAVQQGRRPHSADHGADGRVPEERRVLGQVQLGLFQPERGAPAHPEAALLAALRGAPRQVPAPEGGGGPHRVLLEPDAAPHPREARQGERAHPPRVARRHRRAGRDRRDPPRRGRGPQAPRRRGRRQGQGRRAPAEERGGRAGGGRDEARRRRRRRGRRAQDRGARARRQGERGARARRADAARRAAAREGGAAQTLKDTPALPVCPGPVARPAPPVSPRHRLAAGCSRPIPAPASSSSVAVCVLVLLCPSVLPNTCLLSTYPWFGSGRGYTSGRCLRCGDVQIFMRRGPLGLSARERAWRADKGTKWRGRKITGRQWAC